MQITHSRVPSKSTVAVLGARSGQTFRIRSIRSAADLQSLAEMAEAHDSYFQSHDILGLPKTLPSATAWMSKATRRKMYGCFLEDGRCVGICGVNLSSKMGNFFYSVVPAFQGRGIAKALIRYALIQTRRSSGSALTMDLLVDRENHASIKAAAACGFSQSLDPARTIHMRFGHNPELRRFVFMDHQGSRCRAVYTAERSEVPFPIHPHVQSNVQFHAHRVEHPALRLKAA